LTSVENLWLKLLVMLASNRARCVVAVEEHVHQVAELVTFLAHGDQPVDVLEEHRELTRHVAREQVLHGGLVGDVGFRLEIRIAAHVHAGVDAAILEDRAARGHPIYSYALVTDSEEGLILVDVNTLADGEPRNNFLKRALTWKRERGSEGRAPPHHRRGHGLRRRRRRHRHSRPGGSLKPQLVATVPLRDARASALQFRYLFVADGKDSPRST